MIKQEPYLISANGIYRCVKYLVNITFYVDENGWTHEASEMKGKYSYKKIRKYLLDNLTPTQHTKIYGCKMYNGDILWQQFFLSDPFLFERIKTMRMSSLGQLQFYANNAANWR